MSIPLLIGFFVAVALAGTVLAAYELRGRELPARVRLLHGVAAVVAIALLIVHDMHAPTDPLVNSATAVFVLAAMGGVLLFLLRAPGQPLAGFVVALHAAFALAAVLLLTLGYLSG